jgi:multidrug efflux pump subunit AcrA (membrane-fusion protein)
MIKKASLSMKSKIAGVVLVLFFIAITFMGIRGRVSANNIEQSKPAMSSASSDGQETPVFASNVSLGSVRAIIKTSAEILPMLGVSLNPEAAGKITELLVDVGSVVKKGEKLAQIDNKIQKAQFQEVASVVSVAKSAIKVQEVMIETHESRLVAALAAVDAAESALTNLTITKERLTKLYAEGAVSRQALDDIIAQYDATCARFTGAKSDVKLAEDAIKTAKVTLEMRKAELLRAEANRNSVKVLLDNTLVTAPFDGVITARYLDPGAMANPAAPVLRIEQNDPVKILCALAERDLSQINPQATRILIKLDSFSEVFEGEIRQIYPSVDPVSRTGRIEILLDNKNKKIKTGMFANVSFVISERKNVPVISRDSIMKFEGNNYVYTIEDGKAVRRKINVGITEDTLVEVLSGLRDGDRIISRGIEFIREGARVSAVIGDNAQ